MMKKTLFALGASVLLLGACSNVDGEENVVNQTADQESQEVQGDISLEESKDIAFAHANVDGTKAVFDDQEYDQDDQIFELEFTVDGVDYEYDIDARSGKILEVEKERVDDGRPEVNDPDAGQKDPIKDDQGSASQAENSSDDLISLDEAKQIAFDYAGVDGSKARFDDQELDREDLTYELEFVIDDVEYEFDIHAITGDVLEFERD